MTHPNLRGASLTYRWKCLAQLQLLEVGSVGKGLVSSGTRPWLVDDDHPGSSLFHHRPTYSRCQPVRHLSQRRGAVYYMWCRPSCMLRRQRGRVRIAPMVTGGALKAKARGTTGLRFEIHRLADFLRVSACPCCYRHWPRRNRQSRARAGSRGSSWGSSRPSRSASRSGCRCPRGRCSGCDPAYPSWHPSYR